jgi:hypothetical protein
MTVTITPSAQLHFLLLPSEAQRVAVRRLALSGMPDHDIAAATGWSVDNVRRVVAEDQSPPWHAVLRSPPARRRDIATEARPAIVR